MLDFFPDIIHSLNVGEKIRQRLVGTPRVIRVFGGRVRVKSRVFGVGVRVESGVPFVATRVRLE